MMPAKTDGPQEQDCTDFSSDPTKEELATAVTRLFDEVSELREDKEELRGENEELRARIDELEDDTDDQEKRLEAFSTGLSTAHEEIEELQTEESDVDGCHPQGPSAQSAGSQMAIEAETPLEEIIRVPEHAVEEHLQANTKRTRVVAKDIHEYSRSAPAGRVIMSSEIRRVLSAHEGGATIHTQTVSRVIDRLAEMGKDAVKVRESQQGERTVVFTDDLVKRIVSWQNAGHSVVAERGETG
jgi:hypothetical protein